MWIFHEKIAKIRKEYVLIMRIESHVLNSISGKREGRVLADPNAPSHPIPLTTPPTVLVKYNLSNRGASGGRDDNMRVEALDVGCLGLTPRKK